MKRALLLGMSAMLLFAACTKPQAPEPSTEPSVSLMETPEPTVSVEPEEYFNGLTGEPLDKKPEPTRPYAVMINNLKQALPQCGISKADIIYEVLAEADITRMMAIFSSLEDVDRLGSIRSLRPYYLEISQSYDALLVHAGGSEQAYSDVATEKVENIDGVRGAHAEDIFYRDSDRLKNGYEHSLFTKTETLLEYIPILGYREEHEDEYDYGLRFTEDATPEQGESAEEIQVFFGQNKKETNFSYDATESKYFMEQYGLDYVDGDTDEKVGFTNVLVLKAETVDLMDELLHREMNLTGSGQGYFACGGKYEEITWRRGTNGAFAYEDSQGNTLEFGIGKTYICIVPTDSEDPVFQEKL